MHQESFISELRPWLLPLAARCLPALFVCQQRAPRDQSLLFQFPVGLPSMWKSLGSQGGTPSVCSPAEPSDSGQFLRQAESSSREDLVASGGVCSFTTLGVLFSHYWRWGGVG